MTNRALLAVAHGSPDPRGESVLEALVARIRAERPGLVAVLSYLGHTDPDVTSALRSLAAQGISEVVVVPLLLTAAYHAKVDLPAVLDHAALELPQVRIVQAEVLGPHQMLFELLRRRLGEAGADRETVVVLGAIGTSDPLANAELADVAATAGASIGLATGSPDIADVVTALRRDGSRQVAIASYVLAPGLLPDRFHDTGADIVTEVLGAAPEIVAIVLQRYEAAIGLSGAHPFQRTSDNLAR